MDGGPEAEEPRNEDPAFISDSVHTAVGIIQSYGWFFLAAIIVLLYLKAKFQSRLDIFRQGREDAAYKKMDGAQAMKRHEAMERARAKMQAQFDSQAEEYREKAKERDEKKRQEKLADYEADQQGRSRPRSSLPTSSRGSSTTSTEHKPMPKKSSLRPGYNPLMGDTGGSGYRPTRRGGAGGG